MKKQYKIIDILKLFFAICIVALHTGLLKGINEDVKYYITQIIFRLGVPFFFVVSGYFLSKKIDKNVEKTKIVVKKYIKRLVPPFLVWGGLGILLYGINYFGESKSCIKTCVAVIRQMIFYPSGAMWFVLASMISAVIIGIYKTCNKKHIKKGIIVFAILGYIFALLCNTYYFTVEKTFFSSLINIYLKFCVSARNGFFVGLPLMGMGTILTRYNSEKYRRKAIWLFILFLITYLVEVLVTKGRTILDDNSLYFSTPFLCTVIVYLCLNYKCNFKFDTLVCRNLSTGIYFTHSFYNKTLSFFIKNNMILFFVVLTCSISTIIAIRKSKNEKLINLI